MKQVKTIIHGFSFAKGLLKFFGLEGRRIDEMRSIIAQRTDAEALASDWNAIGSDMKKAFTNAERNY